MWIKTFPLTKSRPENKSVWRVLGLISGTSLDALDAAIIETDGREVIALGASGARVWREDERQAITAAIAAAHKGRRQAAEIVRADEVITRAHCDFAAEFLRREGAVDLIGMHGQTIYHAPAERRTLQLGSAVDLARHCGVPVVADFRAADVAAGGQGAPLAPLYHWALARKLGLTTPLAVANIGGVANITLIASEAESSLIAFDTGAGNGALDDWMAVKTGQPFDRDGRAAAAGKADQGIIGRWLSQPFFIAPPPKSLDRGDFSLEALLEICPLLAHLSVEDGAATLAGFTCRALVRALEFLPVLPRSLIITGGGRHNRAFMTLLKAYSPCPVQSAEQAGMRGDSLEAEAFAYLAARTKRGLPITLPRTTGVRAPLGGGVLYDSADLPQRADPDTRR